jgi:hypothetical protein
MKKKAIIFGSALVTKFTLIVREGARSTGKIVLAGALKFAERFSLSWVTHDGNII